jgi:hypothetical protein
MKFLDQQRLCVRTADLQQYSGGDEAFDLPCVWLPKQGLGFGALSTVTSADCCGCFALGHWCVGSVGM